MYPERRRKDSTYENIWPEIFTHLCMKNRIKISLPLA